MSQPIVEKVSSIKCIMDQLEENIAECIQMIEKHIDTFGESDMELYETLLLTKNILK